MLDAVKVEGSEVVDKSNFVAIENIGIGAYNIRSKSINLKFGESISLVATIEKLPLEIQENELMHRAIMDINSPDLDEIKQKALEIKELPHENRPRALMELLRSKVDYPFDWKLEELSKDNIEVYEWVNVSLKHDKAKISECVKNGFAQCDQFASLLLFLGNVAGLEGTIATYGPSSEKNNIVNVLRVDNGEQLFKSIPLGSSLIAGHAWVEFIMPDRSWMPADPATSLVGDTPDGIEIFKSANYHASIDSGSIYDTGLPSQLRLDLTNLYIEPGMSTKTAIINITPSTSVEDEGDVLQEYRGPLNCSIVSRPEIIFNDLPVSLTNLTMSS